MEIGWIGLGQMGLPMAQNTLKAGHRVSAYNRTRSKAEKLGSQGALVASSPAEAARCGLAVTMVADDKAVESVIFGQDGAIKALPRDGIHVSMSTISVQLAKRLEEAHRAAGQIFISAPVFGRPEAAAARKLFVAAAGPTAAVDKLAPLFQAVGQATFVVGERPSAANAAKLGGNFLIASVIESLGEAFALVEKSGVDRSKFLELITSSLFNAPIYKTYGALIASDNYTPVGFKMELGLKDIRLALAAAEEATVPMPVANLVKDRLLSGIARGRRDDDWASFARLVFESAGLEGATQVREKKPGA